MSSNSEGGKWACRGVELKRALVIFTLVILGSFLHSQAQNTKLADELKILSIDVPGLEKKVSLSVSKMPVQELLRSIALANKVNIVVDPTLDISVTYNFYDITVADLLVFLSRTYALEMSVNAKIISVTKLNTASTKLQKTLSIIVDSTSGLISMDLKGDSILTVIREITRLTGVNIIITPDLNTRTVTAFIRSDTLGGALEKMSIANNLVLSSKDNYFILSDITKTPTRQSSIPPGGINTLASSPNSNNNSISLKTVDHSKLTINANNIAVGEIINAASRALGISYFIYSEMKEPITINLSGISYEQLLNNILNGTKYSFQVDKGVYLFGDKDQPGIRSTRLYKLKFRSATDLMKVIPDKLKKDLSIIEFLELNAIILSGPDNLIREAEEFLFKIDQVVPLVLIEVIIVDFQNGFTISTGFSAGIGDKPTQTSGVVGPGMDLTLGASTVNDIINSFNGLGLLNFGKVNSNFYLSLKLMEDQGIVKIRSTPKLSTLNGHEAIMKISKTQYYLEETSQIFANSSTTQTKVKQYKPINADFSVTLTPMVSADDQITMQIKVDQSDFTGTKIATDAPPDQISRSFTSSIRVRNEEMILLGGLEEGIMKENSSGFPVLSRIPILKWIFSSRERTKKDNRLNIFIKPTLIN